MTKLSPTEQRVLKLFLAEYAIREIATLLNRSPRTIEGIKKRIMEKLEVTTTVGLVRYAFEAGWLDSKTLQPVERMTTNEEQLLQALRQLQFTLEKYLP